MLLLRNCNINSDKIEKKKHYISSVCLNFWLVVRLYFSFISPFFLVHLSETVLNRSSAINPFVTSQKVTESSSSLLAKSLESCFVFLISQQPTKSNETKGCKQRAKIVFFFSPKIKSCIGRKKRSTVAFWVKTKS